jgi:hypothetical protein
MLWGVILLVVGLITGWQLYTPETLPESEYPHLRLYTIMNQQDYYKFPGMPAFLIRGTIGNMFYNMGAALIIIAICFYLIDIKKKENQFISMIIYYGKVSLSLFLIHFVFLPIFIRQFSIIYIPFIVLAYISFCGFFMYIWNEYGNGVGSPEWFMIQIGRIGQRTRERVKEEVEKAEEFISKEFKKTEDFIKKETKKIREKTKELRK